MVGHGRTRLIASAVGVTALMTLGGAPAALGAGRAAADYSFGFSAKTPATGTGLALHIVYRDPDHPDGKPPAVTHIRIETPPGTRIDGGAVPRCGASDAEFRAQARAACPPSSQVGSGTLTVATGVGAPADPYATDVTLFNGPGELIELVTQKETGRMLAIDRVKVRGGVLETDTPSTPGGPPDGKTAVREVDLSVSAPANPRARSYVVTPPECPAGGRWTSRGSFSFDNGAVVPVSGDTPCNASATAKRLRLSVSGVPRGCVRRQFTARVKVLGGATLRRVAVHLNGRTLDAAGSSPLSVRVRARRLHPGRYRLWVGALDAAGGRDRRTLTFNRCAARRRGPG